MSLSGCCPSPRPSPASGEREFVLCFSPRAGRRVTGSRPFGPAYNSTRRSRNALAMTETELRLIAALAIIGLSSTPATG